MYPVLKTLAETGLFRQCGAYGQGWLEGQVRFTILLTNIHGLNRVSDIDKLGGDTALCTLMRKYEPKMFEINRRTIDRWFLGGRERTLSSARSMHDWLSRIHDAEAGRERLNARSALKKRNHLRVKDPGERIGTSAGSRLFDRHCAAPAQYAKTGAPAKARFHRGAQHPLRFYVVHGIPHLLVCYVPTRHSAFPSLLEKTHIRQNGRKCQPGEGRNAILPSLFESISLRLHSGSALTSPEADCRALPVCRPSS